MIFKKSFFVLLPFFLQIKLKNTQGGNAIFGNWKNNQKASYLDGYHMNLRIFLSCCFTMKAVLKELFTYTISLKPYSPQVGAVFS